MSSQMAGSGNAKPVREPADDFPQYELARQEEVRRVDQQRTELEGMRSRTAQYLGFVGAATAFLVGSGLKSGVGHDLLAVLIGGASIGLSAAAVYYAVSVFLGGWSLSKKTSNRYVFSLSSLTTLRVIEADVPRANRSQVSAYLTRKYAEMADLNDPILAGVRKQYVKFLAVGAAQITGWTILLLARG